jgi:hypothetical protein
MSIWKMKGVLEEQATIKFNEGKKLEFYLQIYFATYPINPLRNHSARSLSQEMAHFKSYIETTGSQDPVLS